MKNVWDDDSRGRSKNRNFPSILGNRPNLAVFRNTEKKDREDSRVPAVS